MNFWLGLPTPLGFLYYAREKHPGLWPILCGPGGKVQANLFDFKRTIWHIAKKMGEVLSHLLKTRFPEMSANKVYWARSNNRSSHLAILMLIIVNIYIIIIIIIMAAGLKTTMQRYWISLRLLRLIFTMAVARMLIKKHALFVKPGVVISI